MNRYILDADRRPVLACGPSPGCPTFGPGEAVGPGPRGEWGEWADAFARAAAWMEDERNIRVGRDDLRRGEQAGWLSTVFLGMDPGEWHRRGGPPLLFETMWFPGGEEARIVDRYASWDAAKLGHKAARLALLDAGWRIDGGAGREGGDADG